MLHSKNRYFLPVDQLCHSNNKDICLEFKFDLARLSSGSLNRTILSAPFVLLNQFLYNLVYVIVTGNVLLS